MPGSSVALLVEGFLGLQHPVGEAAGVAGKGDPRLDRSHAATAQLAVAHPEGSAMLGEAGSSALTRSRPGRVDTSSLQGGPINHVLRNYS